MVDNGNIIIDDRLEKQKQYRVRGWCSVTWKDGNYHAVILSIEGNQVIVKVLDNSLAIEAYPKLTLDINNINPATFKKSDSLEGLIDSLKYSHTLVSPIIEEAFRYIDRSWLCLNSPYYDTAIDINCNMCISSPHIHIWYLELCKHVYNNAIKILDIGTGTGYLAATFAYLSPNAHVYGLKYFDDFTLNAKNIINKYLNNESNRITLITRKDGENGYIDKAPYDIIVVGFMCESKDIHTHTHPLINQLKAGGRLIIPIGN
eukprot:GHVR01110549.1.p1 GENE.GHVR01110549.1~~GHVR01110549.1.p1  ORF type:complete len:260 (+),score=55.14 GHVR01110549.1:1947-2726(+)